MKHVYNCKQLNINETEIEYEEVYRDNLKYLKCIEKRFEENLKEREKQLQEILHRDPLQSVTMDCNNG